MDVLKLQFASGESSLSVRSFRVREAISEPFHIAVTARAPSADIDFEGLVGQAASFELRGGLLGTGSRRRWTGVCISCEQVKAEPNGLSTYEVVIVPQLWLLRRRRNHRLFQHVSVMDIAATLLGEWNVERRFDVERENHPPLELRVQYGESDYDFLSRLLEEAGISYAFVDDEERGSLLVLSDKPHLAEARSAPLPFVDAPEMSQAAALEYCTAVRLRRELRAGKVTLRDYDFRKPRYELVAQAAAESESGPPAGVESLLEQYRYVPGWFKTEGHAAGDTPTADDLGVARAEQQTGVHIATRMLHGERARRRMLTFHTNAYDLWPGTTFHIGGHPRAELSLDQKLMMVGLELSGAVDDAASWLAVGQAVFTDTPFRPVMATPKPKITGVQSAYVVGPEDETVYTDEFGRVRVQFHWDRHGHFDPQSSAWMRVSQAWAGPGYGLFNLPRVGHEVLVGFVDGDPDQPVVVGRVFNGAEQVPYPLPGSKLMSGWKSDSNSNIILFDDTPGDEMFYTQAERNRLGIVKRHEAHITGGRKTRYIGTTEKTLAMTSTTRVACGNHTILAGISNKIESAVSFKAESGFGATIKAGRKFEANVTPIVPFLRALMDVKDAKLQILSKLPGGKAPDLKQMLPAYAGGPQPAMPNATPAPQLSQAETQSQLEKTLGVVAQAVSQFEPEEVEALAEAKDLDGAVDAMLGTLEKKGGKAAVQAMTDAQALTQQLKMLSEANAQKTLPFDPSQQAIASPMQDQADDVAAQMSGMFEKLLLAVVELILPKTRITIEFQKIKIETQKASIELKQDDIKIEAKGDISIKADGKVSIEGESVSISPSPCKCG